jgi:hypothetical protein
MRMDQPSPSAARVVATGVSAGSWTSGMPLESYMRGAGMPNTTAPSFSVKRIAPSASFASCRPGALTCQFQEGAVTGGAASTSSSLTWPAVTA